MNQGWEQHQSKPGGLHSRLRIPQEEMICGEH